MKLKKSRGTGVSKSKAVACGLMALAICIICAGCSVVQENRTGVQMNIERIDRSHIEKLNGKIIFFGHQSVGDNIIEGVQSISNGNKESKLNIVELSAAQLIDSPGLYHASVGRNKDPRSKIEDFRRILEQNFEGKADAALLKLCYVDITKANDPEEVFSEYITTVMELKDIYPKTIFVHCTVPIMAENRGIKPFAKRVLGRNVYDYRDNVKREQYNRMLRDRFNGREPLFDIAYYESISSKGEQILYEKNGMQYYQMAPEWTSDGGHLNLKGKEYIATQFLHLLSETIESN